MTTFIIIGDMLVMAFMILLVVWVSFIESPERIEQTANIPLEDESDHG